LDPITHTFTGAALAATGLRRRTRLATAALILGANVPDVDGIAYLVGSFDAIAFRRGWTHGVLALAVWPFVLTALLIAWHRLRPPRPVAGAAPHDAPPLAPRALLALCALAVVTHPALDWLNNYGVRWLMPFDGRWFYGDALFIIDPWLWLALGGALFYAHSATRAALAAWLAFAAVASFLVLGNGALVPAPARALWIAGLAIAAALRFAARGRHAERAAGAALAFAAVYVVVCVAAGAAARGGVRAALAERGVAVDGVMVGPVAANPFAGDVVAAARDVYYTGRWSWLATPHLDLSAETLPRPDAARLAAAAQAPDARKFLSWSRFPVIERAALPDGGTRLEITDARYRALGRLGGPTVELDSAGRPRTAR
jgi:inner membrane protein